MAASLRDVDRGWLRERFDALGRTDYAAYGGPLDDDLFEYVWACLEGLRRFHTRLVDRHAAMSSASAAERRPFRLRQT